MNSLYDRRQMAVVVPYEPTERADGRLFDPTPTQASQRYPFLRHEGPESEFDAIIAAGYTQLDYPV